MTGGFYLCKEREWAGHYVQDGNHQEMKLGSLKIKGDCIVGRGEDNVGSFVLDGRIASNGTLEFQKQYAGKHTVHYKGQLNYMELTGTWAIPEYGLQDAFKLVRVLPVEANESSDSE